MLALALLVSALGCGTDSLPAVPEPALAGAESDVRTQVEEVWARWTQSPRTPAAEACAAASDLAKTTHAYRLLSTSVPAYEHAIASCNDAPARTELLYLHGLALSSNGQSAEAVGQFLRSLELNPDQPPTRLALAELLLVSGRSDEVEIWVAPLLDLPDFSVAAALVLGQAKQDQGEHSKAVDLYEGVLAQRPWASSVHHLLATAYRAQGLAEKASEHAGLAGSGAVGFPDHAVGSIRALRRSTSRLAELAGQDLQAGQVGRAIQRLEEAVEANPDRLPLKIDLAAALSRERRFSEARQVLSEVLARDPGSSAALTNLGLVYAREGDDELAIGYFRDALGLRPGFGSAVVNLGAALCRLGEIEEAMDAFSVLGEAANPGADWFLHKATCWWQMGSSPEAIEVLERALDAYPMYGTLQLALSRILSTAEDDSARDGERALQLAQAVFQRSNRVEAVEAAALAFAEQGDYKSAREMIAAGLQAAEFAQRTDLAERLRELDDLFAARIPARRVHPIS